MTTSPFHGTLAHGTTLSKSPRTIIFCFGGRRANIDLQLPFIRRILDQHPEVEYHLWDLARTAEDSAYLRSLDGDRISVLTDFAGDNPWRRFDDVYRYYAGEQYRGT